MGSERLADREDDAGFAVVGVEAAGVDGVHAAGGRNPMKFL